MTTKCTYCKEGEPELVVLYPINAAPCVPQSCYAYDNDKRIKTCRGINETSQRALDTCKSAGMDEWEAVNEVIELVDSLVCAMGYERTANESV